MACRICRLYADSILDETVPRADTTFLFSPFSFLTTSLFAVFSFYFYPSYFSLLFSLSPSTDDSFIIIFFLSPLFSNLTCCFFLFFFLHLPRHYYCYFFVNVVFPLLGSLTCVPLVRWGFLLVITFERDWRNTGLEEVLYVMTPLLCHQVL